MENEKSKRLFDSIKFCSNCGNEMKYIYGEMFECLSCGRKELSDFGKVKRFLEINGPQPAIFINEGTGVSLDNINKYLREGRIEIPDGSETYIKCQKCGTDIRYGRYCPECMLQMAKNVNQALWMPEVGEKPKITNNNGKMHTLDIFESMRIDNKNNKK